MNEIHLQTADDKLRYKVVMQEVLASNTVKISVTVTALVSAQRDSESLRVSILETLSRFIPEAKWGLGILRRGTNAVVGYEQIVVTAVTQVSSREDYDLHGRSNKASRQGLTLSNPYADYHPSVAAVDSVVNNLRQRTLEKVQSDLIEYEQHTGRIWRIGEINFGVSDYSGNNTMKGAQTSAAFIEDYLDMDDDSFVAGETITLISEVCLYSAPDGHTTHNEHTYQFVK